MTKVLSQTGLTELIQLSKNEFLPKSGAVEATTVALATVATTGSYNDLSNKPTIPTVNNATLTIQKNGSNVATFTANASSNVTANISVPTKVSDLTNDSGFITSITSSDVTTALGYTPYNSSNPSGYQANVIETVKVNGTALTPSSKAVNISVPNVTSTYTATGTDAVNGVAVSNAIATKQDNLVSGTNIKTINGISLLGNGNIDIQGGGGSYTAGNGVEIASGTISAKAGDSTISVDSSGIKVGTIQAANIASNAVITDKIANSAITTAKLSNGVNNNLLHKAKAGNGVKITAGTGSAAAVIALDLETNISASSSNTKAPSAKAVYNVLGDIESVINTIRGV